MGHIDLHPVETFFFYSDISEQQTLTGLVREWYEDPWISVRSPAKTFPDGRVEWDGPSGNYQIARPGESWIQRGIAYPAEHIQATYRPAAEWTEPSA